MLPLYYVRAIRLVLGLLNLVAFTPTIMTIGGGLRFTAMNAEIMIGIQLFSLLVFLTFVYAHRQGFMAWINKDGLERVGQRKTPYDTSYKNSGNRILNGSLRFFAIKPESFPETARLRSRSNYFNIMVDQYP